MYRGVRVEVVGVRAGRWREALGIGEARPPLSWRVRTDARDWTQAAYTVSDGVHEVRVDSAESVMVGWPFAPLGSRERVDVRVRVAGSGWSAPLAVEAGLLDPGEWRAAMVAPAGPLPSTQDGPAWLLRRAFTLPAPPVRARLYASALGAYALELNGRPVGDEVLAPGWTSYRHRLRYRTHDVTGLLRAGDNVLGGWLADGWYRGRLGYGGGRRAVYGDTTALLAQLEVACADGTTVVVSTDEAWRGAPGPITATGLYDGERHDARRERPGWSTVDFDDGAWDGVRVQPFDPARLVAPDGPPVRRIERRPPVATTTDPAGRTIVDFGQNLTGRLAVRIRGEAGQVVRLRHAEVLRDGGLAVEPLRHAAATDEYVLAGPGEVEWEPRFTLHGFRYAEVTGPVVAVEAVVCHTDMARTGWFSCSDPRLERLHENVVWSMRGNFVDLPTDCPQRDERLGWTGDLAVFAPTAAFLYDCAGMLASWLADLAAEQAELGTVPPYVPWVELGKPPRPAAVWGDAAVTAPWVLHERFGDLDLLRRQYASMVAWVDQVAGLAGPGHRWDTGFQYGDWLDPAAPPDDPGAARTAKGLVATAYHAHTARIAARVAGLLGRSDDERRLTDLADAVTAAFRAAYVVEAATGEGAGPRAAAGAGRVAGAGRMSSDAQTAYALAIELFGDHSMGPRLVELVAAEGYHVGTGFVGTPRLLDALTTVGALDDAYRLLLQTECPSWLYPVTMGATTIWERWDSLLPDGRINPGRMTSFNHYAFGAVADWLHRTVAGLTPTEPGYRRFLVRPRPGGGLTRAAVEHDSPYGRIAVAWELTATGLDVAVTVPPNTRADVDLDGPQWTVGSGRHRFSRASRSSLRDPDPS